MEGVVEKEETINFKWEELALSQNNWGIDKAGTKN